MKHSYNQSIFWTLIVLAITSLNVNMSFAQTNADCNGREDSEILALYTFYEGSGNVVHDVSGSTSGGYGAYDLTIQNPGNVTWLPGGGLRINAATIIKGVAGGKIFDDLDHDNELTVEAWVKPSNTWQNGPARIATMSLNTGERNFTLGQQGNQYVMRVRTDNDGDNNGFPEFFSGSGSANTNLTHVVYTLSGGGDERLYINGSLVQTGSRDGDFANFSSNHIFALGNEITMDRAWLGELHLVAVYDDKISDSDVLQNYNAGPCTDGTVDGGFQPPSDPTCAGGNFLWSQDVDINNLNGGIPVVDVRFVDGGTFTIPGPYPAAFNSAITLSIEEAISWDGYTFRDGAGVQAYEKWRVVFKKNGSVVHSTGYTGDIADGVLSAEWIGSLGSNIYLPNGTDEILLVHYEDGTYGNGSASTPNSVVPVSICISYSGGCDNVTSGGQIGVAQSGCSPFDPNTITNIGSPSGGSGAMEYVWLKSTNGGSSYSVISGATSSTYNPGPITQTTWYRRCARRAGCSSYVGESNWLQMTVTGTCCNMTVTAQSTNASDCDGDPVGPDFDGCCQEHGNHNHISGWNLKYVGPQSPATIDFISSDNNYGTVTYNGTHSFGDHIFIEADDRFDTNVEFTINGTDVEVHASCSQATNVGYGIDSNGDFVPNPNPNDANILFIIYGLATAEDGWCGVQTGGGCDGTATLNPSNGTAPFTYLWSDGSTQGNRTDLCPGTYSVTVTDANGCTATTSVTIACQPVCDNVTDPGLIGYDQEGCYPFNPVMIQNLESPSGGSGALEYVWLVSTNGGSSYSVIPGANGETYDPPVTSVDQWFRRCARRAGCTSYVGESNWIHIDVTGSCPTDCNDALVSYGGQCADSPDAFYLQSSETCIGSATNLYPINGSSNASCDDDIICVASQYNPGWEFSFVANANTTIHGANIDLLYPIAMATAGGASNSSNCATTFNYYVEFYLNDNLIETVNGSIPADVIVTEVVNLSSPRVIQSGDEFKVQIKGDPVNSSCDLFENAGTVVFGCCGGDVCETDPPTANNYTFETTVECDQPFPNVTFSDASGIANIEYSEYEANEVCEIELSSYTTYNWRNAWFHAFPAAYDKNFVWEDGYVVVDENDVMKFTGRMRNVTLPESGFLVTIYSEPLEDWNTWIAGGGYDPADAQRMNRRYAEVDFSAPNSIVGFGEFENSNLQLLDNGGLGHMDIGPRDVYGGYGGGIWVEYGGYVNGMPAGDNLSQGQNHFDMYFGLNNCIEVMDGCYGLTVRDWTVTDNCGNAQRFIQGVHHPLGCDMEATCSATNGTCNNGNVGTASVSVSGGQAPYTYLWDNGATTSTISGLSAGQYCVTVTDANGCEVECCATVTIESPCCDNVTNGGVIAEDQENCGGFDPATITSVSLPSGGSGAMEYIWLVRPIGGSYTVIPGATGPTYDPPFTNESVQYRRCARRAGCTPWAGESNWVTITVHPNDVVATCSKVDGNCNNGNVGSASVSVSGGTGPYTYLWSTGATTVSISNLTAGSYSVQVTDVNGCTADCSVTITTTPCCNVTDPGEIAANQENCGPFDPEPFTSVEPASGGIGPVEYLWLSGTCGTSVSTWTALPNSNSETYDVGMVSTTTCFIRCSRNVGCTQWVGESNIITITVGPGCCDNVTNGGIIAEDQENCGGFDPAMLTSVSLPSGGSGAMEYIWLVRPIGGSYTVIPGATGPTYNPPYTNESVQYRRCARRAGCTPWAGESNWVTITVHPNDVVANCSKVDGNCNNGNVGSASVSVSGGSAPYTYLWSTGATTVSVSNLTAGSYSVQVTDVNGCTADCSVTVATTPCCNVTDPGEIAANQENCGPFDPEPFTSVAPASGGIGPVEYLWLSGTCGTPVNTWTALPNSNSATYDAGMVSTTTCFIRCSRNEGCTQWVGESNIITITVGPGCCDNVTNGGLIAEDQENCGGFDPATITSVTLPSGGSGAMEYIWLVRPIGGSYTVIPGATGPTYDPPFTNESLQYRRCARRENCTPWAGESNWVTITVHTTFELECDASDASSWEASDGSVGIIVDGGTAPYTYLWSTGATTASISNVPAGVYSVTVTDANGCEAWKECCVKHPPFPEICIGFRTQTQGGWGANPNGANPGAYLHANFNTAFPSGIQIGCSNTFTFTSAQAITDYLPCGGTATSLPAGNVNNPSCAGNVFSSQVLAASISVGFDNAIPNFSTSTVALEDLIIRYGTFQGWTVEELLEEANRKLGGCSSSYSYSELNNAVTAVNENYVDGNVTGNYLDCCDLTIACSSENGNCSNGNVASASVTATGGTAPYTYAWSNGSTTASISGLDAGTYEVTVTDATGCDATCSVTVSETPCCNVTNGGEIATDQENCGPFDPAAFTSVSPASGGLGDIEYLWLWNPNDVPFNNGNNGWVEIPNSNSETYDPGYLTESRCFIRCARRSGCTAYVGESNVICVTINPVPVATCTPVNGDCNNGNQASASVSVTGGTAPYTYLWSTGATTVSISNLTAGSYSVTVTDVNGCTDDCSVTVTTTPCCNVTDPGEIAANQENCGPFDPAPFTSVAPATGGIGPVEYLWLQGECGTPVNTWTAIPNSNSETYDAGMITETTCFIRCSRNEGCTAWVGESNIITITVGPGCCDNVTNGGIIAEDQENCGGFDPELLTSVTLPSGGSGAMEYIWLMRPIGGSYTVIPGATGPTYDPPFTNESLQYRRCARRENCEPWAGESNWVTITVHPNDVVATCSKVDGTCSNNNQGSASVSASGGTAPYTYLWSTGATTVSISNLTAGSYSVTVTDVNGCTNVCDVVITTTPCCNATDPGSIADSQENCGPFDPDAFTSLAPATGGLGDIEYQWYEKETETSWMPIPGATGETYDAPFTSVNKKYKRCARRSGCTDYAVCSNVLDIMIHPDNMVATCSMTPVDCNGALTGTASVAVQGGSGTYTYAWSNGGTTATISGLAAGTYSVSVTDMYGCTSDCSVEVTEPADLTAQCTSTNGGCNNNNQGSASVSPAGGTAPYTYLWSNGATTATITGLASGAYSVTVTDANGCTETCSTNVQVEPCCNVTDPGEIAADQENCGPFDPAPFTSVAPATGGIGPVEYLWLQGECGTPVNTWTAIPNSNSETYDAGMITETTCFIRCSRNEGCTQWVGESNIITIAVHPDVVATCSSQNGNCNNNNEASASVSVSGGTAPFSYAWSNGATTQSISGLAAGTYSVTVTDANGCSDDCSVTVSVTPCCNVTDPGEIAADQENCGGFDPARLTSVELPSGGLGDLEYIWIVREIGGSWSTVPGATEFEYDPPFTSVSLQYRRCARRSGCTSWVGESNIITITVFPEPVATCSSVNGDCSNNNEASALVSVSGGTAPYTYLWSTGATTVSISNLTAGSYSVTVTDANGCTDDCSVTVTTTPCCNATDPGSIADSQDNCGPFDPDAFTSLAPATGGLGDIEYQWYEKETETSWMPIPGATGETYDAPYTSVNKKFKRCARRSGCTEYSVCSNILDIMIHPDNMVATCSMTPVDCNGASTGTATVDVQGGSGSYTYAWSNGGTTATITGLAAGTYTVSVTDMYGCTSSCSVTVTEPADLTAQCTSTNGGCNNNNQGSASVTPNGGTAPYTYLWSNGATTATITGLASGTYSVTVTGANGCTETCSTNVTVEPCCNVTDPGEIAADQENCGPFDPAPFTSVAPATGGIGPVEYLWLRGECGTPVNSWTAIPNSNSEAYDAGMITETTCFIRCSRNEGCTQWVGESNIITITVHPDDVVATCSATPADCNGASTGSVSVSASGGAAPYTVLWSSGATTMVVNNLMAGSYSVTVTDANGCSNTCTAVVEEPAALIATCSSENGDCNNSNEASASVSAAGGTAPYSYLWSNGSTSSSISGLAAGTYSVTVTDANGCVDDCTVTVTTTPCCNVTDGGEITGAQENCGPFDPDAITSVTPASGGLGDLEYIWLWNDEDVPFNNGNNGWVEIPGSNSESFDPGYLTESRCYIRCARRSGCTTYVGESNVICMTVHPEPVATCTSVNGDCNNNNEASASVSVNGGTAPYSYAWSNGASTASISGLADGTYSVTVTDANGCTDECSVTVTTTPCCDVTDPGTVAGDQDGCGPFDPDAFTSVAPASGGLGGIVYQWYQKETETSWMPIPGANGETYDPGMISVNTQFKRCARREGCPEFTFCSNTIFIEVHPVPNANCTSVSGNCNNGNGASATVSVQGGTPQYTYLWSNGETTATIEDLADGTYSVTVTDELGCTDDCSVTVTTNECCNVTDPGEIAANQENCGPFDPAPFTSLAPASGGIGPVEYVWLSGACGTPINTWAQIPNSNSETLDVGMVTETTCYIRCARNSGCSPWVGESNIITVTVNDEPVATCTSVNGDCNNNNEASASVSATGGSGVYSYLWSNGATTGSISGIAAGTYSVTVTDLNGCSDECSVTVTTTPCCNVTDPGEIAADQENCGPFDPAPFTSVAPATGGIGPVEYLWLSGECGTPVNTWTALPNSNSETYDAGMVTETTCFIRCARNEGCSFWIGESNIITVTVNDGPELTCNPINGDCNNNNEASASVSVNGGTAPYSYAWSNGATTASISGLSAGTYSVVVTDANGCTSDCSVTVDVAPCCNVTDGGEINNAQENCGPFDPDVITSIAPASGGLGDLEYVWLMNDEDVPFNNGNNGWVEIPGSNSETYDPGMITETTCYIRCARREGCTVYIGESNIVCMVVNESPIATCTSTDSGCNGNGTGTATASVNGGEAPYTYLWSNGETTATITDLVAGTYSVTVTDVNGCTDDCTATVGQPSGLSVSCDATDVDCHGNQTGTATGTATGGTAPYSYSWSNGGTTETITGLGAGSYNLTVTDANGCTATCQATVYQEGLLTADCSSTDVECNGATTGSVSVVAGGGTHTYTYLWSNGATIATVDNLGAGTYTVTVTDGNGCTETCSATINEPAALVATCTPVNGDCNNNNEASASVSVDGGTAPYTVLWSTGATTMNISNLTAGSYSVTVTDANGCEATCDVTVVIEECCNVTDPGEIAADQSDCGPFDPEPFTSVAPATGGNGPVEYVWLQGECGTPVNTWTEIPNSNSETLDVGMVNQTTCFIRCARNVGCTAWVGESNIITITVGPGCCDNVTDGGEIGYDQENCGPFDPDAFTSITPASGGSGDLEYIWLMNDENVPMNNGNNGWVEIPNSNTEAFDPGMITETTCFIRCARREGCEDYIGESNVICIVINPADLTATCTPVNGDCNNGNSGSASVSANGGEAPYTYEWSNGETTATIDGLAAGTYTVTVTDANGCSATCDAVVEVEGCCNVTDGGEIAADQNNCGPFEAATLTSVSPATGGMGDLEYIWLMNDENVPMNNGNNGWVEIPGSNSETYDPGMITETTCFIRCARREGCNVYVGESNVVCVTIYPAVEVACNPTHGDCTNNGVGAVSTSITGGTAPFTYAWSNGETTADISGLTPGSYSVTVTDANGCTADCSVTVTSEPCCNVTDPGEIAADQENCGPFDPAPFTSVAPATGGIGPVEYLWLSGECGTPVNTWTAIPNSNSETYDAGMITETTCFIRCARNVGCTAWVGESNIITITVNDGPQLTCEGVNGDCNNNNEAAASVSVDGGEAPFSYAWSNGETTASISGLAAGTYSVTVTDANGCESTCDVTVVVEECCNVTDPGEIAADQSDCGPFDPEPFTSVAPATGGIGPVEYLWLSGECGTPVGTWTELPNSNSETYDAGMVSETTCFIRCSRNVGCTAWVGESNIITITVGPGCCDNVTDGGEIGNDQENCGPFDPAEIISVVDPSGGSGDLEYVWLWNDENVPMNNGNNGWVEIPNSNASTYNPGILTETTCFIRCVRREGCEDYVGESNVICITINPADLVAVCTPTNGDCNNGNSGSASVTADGGEAPYTYEWSNGETTASIDGLAAGSYTVTVTDANGCTATCDAVVEVEGCCNVTDGGEIAEDQENCGPFEAATLTSVVDPSGGLGDMEIIWISRPGTSGPWQVIPGATGLTLEPGMVSETTQYRRCARRAGCSDYDGESNIITITILPAVEVECYSMSGDCGNGNMGSAGVDVVNGEAPYSYLWSNGETTAEITGLEAGTYTVTVTDANGCTATCTEEVIVTPCCNVTDPGEIAADQTNCVPFDPEPFTSVAPATGGIGPVEYLWLMGDCNTPISQWAEIPNSNSETYDPGMITETTCFIRCARNSGCEPWIGESNIITITIYNSLTIECSSVSGDCGNGNATSASVDVLDGTAPYTYEWSNGATTASIEDIPVGTYTVTVTDANGCTASCTEEIIVTPCCNVTDPGEIAADQENCGPFDPEPFTSVAPATGGIGPVEYLWLRGECGTPISQWMEIPNSNSETLDVDSVFETTCFIRCARNESCEPWVAESNIITITVYPALELSCNGVNGDCSNGNEARAISHIAGGAEPYSILWSNGDTTAIIDGLDAGTYTVYVTDANGCEAECSVTVEVTPCCNVTDGGEIAADQENCGPFDPEVLTSVTPATGGIGPVEYAWYSGPCPGPAPTVTNSLVGNTAPSNAIPPGFNLIVGATGESYDPGMITETTCFIRVARNQGCEEWIGESNIVTITVNPAPQLSCVGVDGDCENGNIASASVSVSGAPSPFTYFWSNGEETATIDSLEAGVYTVMVTDGNGCEATCSTEVDITPCCNVTDGGEIASDQENCGPFDPEELTSVTPATGGIGPVEYAWYSGPCPGPTPTITNSLVGNNAPVNAIPPGFNLIVGATGESYDPGNLEETTCFIRVARNQGCEEWLGESNIITITINSAPELACSSVNGDCENGNVGSASVNVSNAPSPFSYAWSNGAETASIENLDAGSYSVVVTDGNGCVDSCTVEVEVVPCCNVTDGGEIAADQENCGPFDPDPIVSVTPATGGIGPVEYAWYSGPCPGPAPTAIPPGFNLIVGATGESYDPGMMTESTCFIRVARNEGCEDWIGESNIVTISVHDVPTVEIAVTGGANPSCSGEVIELTAQASGTVDYAWSTGETTASIEVTESGTYVVSITDENGCMATDSIEVEFFPLPEVEIEITGGNPFCDGDSTMLTANCATAVGYMWSTGETGTSIWVTEAGTYSVEVVDSNQCMASTSVEIDVYELPEVEISIDGSNPLCDGDSALLVAISQGAMGYEWSTGANTDAIWVTEPGTYTVTVVDEVGCENSTSYEVIDGLEPLIEIVGNSEACEGDSIILTAQYAGGEALLWSTGQTTQEIVVTESGEYCVVTASIDGCQAEACIEITINPNPEVEVEIASGANPFCEGDSIELAAISQNAVGYVWSNGSTDASIWVTEAGTYAVEVTDANGCTSEAEMAVGTVESPEVTIEGPTELCTGDSIMLTALTAKAVDFVWSTGETTESIWVYSGGDYCVTATSNHGCVTEVCVTITESAVPEVYAGEDVNICVGDNVMLTATGGDQNTVYTWYLDGEVVDVAQSITVSPGVGLSEYTVVAVNEFCSIESTDDVKVWVYDYPLAGFERDPAGDVPFGSDVNFTDTTIGLVTDWHWDFGDGMTSMLQHPSHNYTDPGSYWVTLIASNNGCEDTAVAGLEVKIIIDIPNVFTPNNDGVNDVIWLQGTDLELIKMTIYNRWGHSVYASEGRQFSWSGKNSGGSDCEPGTYYYVIEMHYKDGNFSEQTGFFTLIRN